MKFKIAIVFTLSVTTAFSQTEFQKKFQTAFIEAENGEVIELPEGTYSLEISLWLDDKKDVTIKGKGMDKTILNFRNQLSGAEGIKITNSTNITIADLTVQDTKGDGIKAQQVTGIAFHYVKVEWTRGANSKNGGYGIYPVQCEHVLIDNCVASGASDAGIYVGQSSHVLVNECKAYQNVAGIEIENTSYADVQFNEIYNNTGGLLIFDLPDLVKKRGGYCRALGNKIRDNNHVNFAPKGNIVGKVPQGTGIMILAANNVELFQNIIQDNRTIGIAVISYFITENPIKDSLYDPYPSRVYVHNNTIERKPQRATMRGRIGKLYRFKLKFGKDVPNIVWDGIVDEKAKGQTVLCIDEQTNATFANLDAENNFKNISRNIQKHHCQLDRIPPVAVNVE